MPILLMLIVGTVVLGNFLNVKTQTDRARPRRSESCGVEPEPAGRHGCGRCAVREPVRPDQVRHRAGHQDRVTAHHPVPPRPPPGHHHGNGDHAMRWLTEADRDDRGVATIFVILAMAAVVIGAALAIDVGGYVVAARSAQNSADATALAVATDCAAHRRPDRRLRAVPQGRPDHHRPGVRQRRSHDHRDQGGRRLAARAERRRRQPERDRPMGNPQRRRTRSRLVIADCEFRSPSDAARQSRCTSTTRSRRAGARRCPAASVNSTRPTAPSRSLPAEPSPGHGRRRPAEQDRACLTNPRAGSCAAATVLIPIYSALELPGNRLQGQGPVSRFSDSQRLEVTGYSFNGNVYDGSLGKKCPDEKDRGKYCIRGTFKDSPRHRAPPVPAPTSVSHRSTSTASTQLTTRRTTPQ